MRLPTFFRTVLLAAAGLLAGCDMLGIESAEKIAAAREADGKAIGGACRHAGRAIEIAAEFRAKPQAWWRTP